MTYTYEEAHTEILPKLNAKYEYIGQGVIYTVDGVLQHSTQLLHFWRKRSQ